MRDWMRWNAVCRDVLDDVAATVAKAIMGSSAPRADWQAEPMRCDTLRGGCSFCAESFVKELRELADRLESERQKRSETRSETSMGTHYYALDGPHELLVAIRRWGGDDSGVVNELLPDAAKMLTPGRVEERLYGDDGSHVTL